MPKQVFGTAKVPLSPAVRAGDFVFVSGQVPVGADGKVGDGGIEAQTAFVEDAVRARILEIEAEAAKRMNADRTEAEVADAVDKELRWARW